MAGTTVTASAHGPTTSGRPQTQEVREESRWRRWAVCRGTDPAVFFPVGPPTLARLDEERAKAMCSSCPVRAGCFDYAVEHGEIYGVWGGLTGAERWALTASSTSSERTGT